jgi:hypothetical protein
MAPGCALARKAGELISRKKAETVAAQEFIQAARQAEKKKGQLEALAT